jgi:glycosyltransferase involved in cell wall biosynthesis
MLAQPPTDPPAADCRPTIVALIPAYNEERFIASVVLKTRRYVDEVWVVDDGSGDATAELAQAAGATVLRHPGNRGKGAALNTGFAALRARPGDCLIVTLDADGQHEPADLPAVLAPLRAGADLVIGSRYLDGRCPAPPARVLGHRLFNALTRLASGVPASDSQSGYRAFSRRALEAVTFTCPGFAVESEMQFLAGRLGLRLVEAPIAARYVDKPKRPLLGHGLAVLHGLLRLTGQYRPLLCFGAPGLVLLAAGLLGGVAVVNRYHAARVLPVGYATLSALLAIAGMIALSTAVTLHSVRGLLNDFLRSSKGKGWMSDGSR